MAEIADFGAARGVRGPLASRRAMVIHALRPISHLAAWLVWHSTGVSLLRDLEAPRPPAA